MDKIGHSATAGPRRFDVGLKHFRAAHSVAYFGSFTAAAADLGMTQSAVSRLVIQLEQQLGATLFLRTTRNVVLTGPGREFIASTTRILDDLNIQVENARSLQGQARGRLIISCLLSITHHIVPSALLKYRREHPGVEVHLREGLGSEVHEDVRSGLADFGIGNAVGLNQEVVADEIVQESCFAVLPDNHRLRNKRVVSLKDLKDDEFVSLPTGSGLRRQIDGAAAAGGLALKHMTIVEQFGSLFDFVAASVGVAVVPASALPDVRQYRVIIKQIASPAIVRQIGILRLRNRALTPAATGFLDIFRPRFLNAARR